MTALAIRQRKVSKPRPHEIRLLNVPEDELNTMLIREFEQSIANDDELQELFRDEKPGV